MLVSRAVPAGAFAVALRVRHRSLRVVFELALVRAIVASASLGFVGLALYAFATVHGQLAIASVLGCPYAAVTVLLACRVLGERVNRAQQLGIAAMLAGVALMSAGSSTPSAVRRAALHQRSPWRKRLLETGSIPTDRVNPLAGCHTPASAKRQTPTRVGALEEPELRAPGG